MPSLVPSGKKFDRSTLERIIRRAAELQANQQELGDDLTEDQVIELGKEVGLPARYVQQAILEEKTRARTADNSMIVRWLGARRVSVQRTVPGDESQIERALSYWMEHEELLTVKRRYKTATTWEPRKGFIAAIRRMGGKSYALTRAREVMGEATQLESGWSHVRLEADLSNSRSEYLWGAGAIAGGGVAIAIAAAATGLATAAIVLPPAVAVGAAGLMGTARKPFVERVKVALEQILDRLEHREIDPEEANRSPSTEIGKAIGEVRRQLKNLGPGHFLK